MLEKAFRNRPQFMCIGSRIEHADQPFAPLFFYHVPKTGGLSFFTAMRSAMGAAAAFGDRSVELRGNASRGMRMDGPVCDAGLFEEDFGVIASHLSFGFHRNFRQDFRLATIVRDAVGRVCSDYTYTSMRRQEAVSGDRFQAHFRQERNINRATKQLAGQVNLDEPASADLLDRAIANLEGNFEAFVTHQQINDLIRYYLSVYKLPNVLMDRLNVTLPAYRLDPAPWKGEIIGLNAADYRLYQYVRDHARLPRLELTGDRCHGRTVIINGIPGASMMYAQADCLPTDEVLRRAA